MTSIPPNVNYPADPDLNPLWSKELVTRTTATLSLIFPTDDSKGDTVFVEQNIRHVETSASPESYMDITTSHIPFYAYELLQSPTRFTAILYMALAESPAPDIYRPAGTLKVVLEDAYVAYCSPLATKEPFNEAEDVEYRFTIFADQLGKMVYFPAKDEEPLTIPATLKETLPFTSGKKKDIEEKAEHRESVPSAAPNNITPSTADHKKSPRRKASFKKPKADKNKKQANSNIATKKNTDVTMSDIYRNKK